MAAPADGFFHRRRKLDFDPSGGLEIEMVGYVNIPNTIAQVVSSGRASLVECATVLSLEDVYDLLEVEAVNVENQRRLNAHRERMSKR